MSKKSDLVTKLLSRIELRWPAPTPIEGANLLEQGLHAVLLRRLDPKAAARGTENLRKAFGDWNELRVAQAQEIATALKVGQAGVAAAGDVRAYLQEVFQRSHGLDLEFLRNDAEATKRFLSILPFIGMGTAHYLLWLASDGELPVSTSLARVLDRVGLMTRTANPKKARAALGPLVPKSSELEFAIKVGEVATRWCDAKKPLCHQCPIVDDCRYGKKAYREWRVQQERMEAQRVREEARLAAVRAREEAKRQREQERLRKKAEAEAARKARAAEAAKRAAERKAAASKKAAQRKAAVKKAARKAAKKKPAKKAAKKALKKGPARKPAASRAASKKRPASRARARKA